MGRYATKGEASTRTAVATTKAAASATEVHGLISAQRQTLGPKHQLNGAKLRVHTCQQMELRTVVAGAETPCMLHQLEMDKQTSQHKGVQLKRGDMGIEVEGPRSEFASRCRKWTEQPSSPGCLRYDVAEACDVAETNVMFTQLQ